MNPIGNQKNFLENIPEGEFLAEIRERQSEFESKYKEKLEKILPKNLVDKISGSFENSGKIEESLEKILKEKGILEENISRIKDFLLNNLEIGEENLEKIQKNLENSEILKELDLKLGELISKISKISEEKDDDKLFEKLKYSKKIQENGTLEEKQEIVSDLEKILSEDGKNNFENVDGNEEFLTNDNGNNNETKELGNNLENSGTQEKVIGSSDENGNVFVESADSGNDRGYIEETILTGDLFSKDREGESNDYGNENKKENQENLLQKGINAFKGEKNEEGKNQENYSEINGEYFPILESLLNSGEIKKEQFDSINKELSGKSTQEKKGYFKNFIEKLPNSENKTNILKNFDEKKEEITEKNFEKTDFFTDSKSIIDFDKSVGGVDLMLAENYISITNKEIGQEKNIEQNINTSMEITKNKIIKSKSVDFKNNNAELIGEISSEKNLDKKYKKLKELYKEGLKDDAKKGGKKGKEEMERKKEDLIGQYKETLEKIKESEKKGDTENLKKLNKDKQKIEQEAKETETLLKEIEKIARENDLDLTEKSENGPKQKE